jgi:hypothetical protein
MSQSRGGSLVEALANVIVGYALAVGLQMAVFPHLGITLTLPENLGLGALFTVASLLRSYLLRRLFDRLGGRAA